jgi:CTP:molybdopterin cytidylyltransferase MocA
MGRCKALLRVDGVPLIARHVQALRAVGLPVVVVTRPDADGVAVAEAARGATVVVHPSPDTTDMYGSLWAALSVVPRHHDLLVTPVDVPPASEALLRALMRWDGDRCGVVPHGNDGDGHPVRVRRAALTEAPAEGLRTVLRGAERMAWPAAVAVDFDDPAAWRRFLDSLRGTTRREEESG